MALEIIYQNLLGSLVILLISTLNRKSLKLTVFVPPKDRHVTNFTLQTRVDHLFCAKNYAKELWYREIKMVPMLFPFVLLKKSFVLLEMRGILR